MKKTCLFVESSCVGAAHTAEAARRLGYEPFFLTDPAFSQGDTRLQILGYPHRECKTTSVEAMVPAAREVGSVTGVTSFSDTCLMNASELAGVLGGRGLDPAVARLKDKWEAYRLVPEFSPPSIDFLASQVPVEALQAMIARHGTVMVKGRRNSGGQGSLTLRTADQVHGLAALLAKTPIPAHLGPDLFMAQAFIDGALVSLEGFVSEGQAHFLGFSGRHKVGMSESRIIFPWDDKIDARARDRAYQAMRELVSRSGLQRGYFHVEFMIAEGEAYLIDANVGRIGGGGLGQQIALAHGLPPEEVHAHALALSIGDPAPTPEAYRQGPQRRTISIMYGTPVDAEFLSLKLPSGLPGYHTTILDAPQRVTAMGTDNYAWIAIASGEDGRIQGWVDEIIINTSEGSFSPVY
jgi:hypothetical protein